MSESFLGQIMPVAFNFPPRGWAQCNGQLLAIAQNQALFALLGTTYGGNGTTTFGLPDLRGRTPIHFGQGPGLPNVVQGQVGGVEAVTLSAASMPAHTHAAQASTAAAAGTAPAGNVVGTTTPMRMMRPAQVPPVNQVMNPAAVQPAGSTQAHANLQPYLTVMYVIALQGIFPSRN